MWTKIARLILRNRIAFLTAVGIITIFMGYQASQIEMDYHYANMLSKDDPVYLDNVKFKKTFGDEANGIVIGIVDKDIFNIKKFQALQKLCVELKKIKNVSGVLTVCNAVNIRQVTKQDENGVNRRQFETYNMFPDKIESQAQLDSLKNVFLSLPFYKGLLYNETTHVYILNVSIDKKILNSKERIPTVHEIERVVKEYAAAQNIEVHLSGHPYIRTQMMDLIKSEVKLFIILAAVICMLILYLLFRSFKVLGVAMIVVGVSVIWSVGLMGLFDYKITILSGMIPPLLIVIGIPNTIFLLNKYHSETKAHGNKILALQRVISRIGNAVFLSNATTAAGFATFIITNSSILVQFGIIASLGIIFTFIIALIVIPSIFSFLQPPSDKYTKHLGNKYINKLVDFLTNIVNNHRPKVYITVSIVLAASIFGITQIKKTGYLLDDVPADDPIYVDLKFLEKNFNGVSPLEIAIEAKDSLQGLDMVYQIQKIDSLQMRLAKYPELSRSMSVADAIKFLYQSYSKGNPEKYTLPPDPKTYETIFKRLPNGLDQKLAKAFIDSTQTITRISLNIEDIGTNRMQVLLPKIKKDIYEVFPKEKYNTLVTGSTIIYFTGTTYLINNLFISLALAVLIIALLMFGLQRSPKMVLISLIPNLIPMLVTAALMGYFGIPIKPSTILVFGIALGISVDGTIHFITKYRQELSLNNWNIGLAVKKALRETGTSMMYTSFILFFGFLIFTASEFGGTKALGFLMSMTLLVAMICNLILLPTMLMTLEKFINKKEFPEPILDISDEVDVEDYEDEDTLEKENNLA
ncbi:MAG: MMPL family transporter [Bacteroidales bacterium]|nr:MMPL family transporter [Bacteroidales bacterium]